MDGLADIGKAIVLRAARWSLDLSDREYFHHSRSLRDHVFESSVAQPTSAIRMCAAAPTISRDRSEKGRLEHVKHSLRERSSSSVASRAPQFQKSANLKWVQPLAGTRIAHYVHTLRWPQDHPTELCSSQSCPTLHLLRCTRWWHEQFTSVGVDPAAFPDTCCEFMMLQSCVMSSSVAERSRSSPFRRADFVSLRLGRCLQHRSMLRELHWGRLRKMNPRSPASDASARSDARCVGI
jgi:hypothetical protein